MIRVLEPAATHYEWEHRMNPCKLRVPVMDDPNTCVYCGRPIDHPPIRK